MSDVSGATTRIFEETAKFLVLGLTGRTGSGCSTAAKILSQETLAIPEKSKIYGNANDHRKYQIVRRYMGFNWKPFVSIQIRSIITGIILELSYDDFVGLISLVLSVKAEDVRSGLAEFESTYAAAHEKIIEYKSLDDLNASEKETKKKLAWVIYFEYLPEFCENIKATLQRQFGIDAYTTLYQRVGDNIRASGCANSSVFDKEKVFTIPKIVNQVIKAIRFRNPHAAFITIDAIRNPFEAVYFHQRYAGFYLLAINTPEDERLSHLRKAHKFSEPQIKALDDKEYPRKLSGKEIFVSQNIQRCIELADIHINNPNRQKYNNSELVSQLIWYVSLIFHPGLVTPTSTERCMQLAFSAKLNSGCISRQVGAVVTGSDWSVKAVGWNSTPQGQTPCILRSAQELLDGGDESVYSSYERLSDDFHRVLEDSLRSAINSRESTLRGRNFAYCFKDLQNEVDGEKNQVHTRSLHAEENAFLQISKYGGAGVQGGTLFTTASPCELCSKKAYQLGIKKVFYIDPYPGISMQHILGVGKNIPELSLFSGAVGRAYHRLYQPLISYKDELQMLTDFTITGGNKKNKKELRLHQLEQENEALREKLNAIQAANPPV